jgi:hypothetical protein
VVSRRCRSASSATLAASPRSLIRTPRSLADVGRTSWRRQQSRGDAVGARGRAGPNVAPLGHAVEPAAERRGERPATGSTP